jgi:tetratricopeptide (TPR) repeat protein
MRNRVAPFVGAILVMGGLAAAGSWWLMSPSAPDPDLADTELPVPPVPPRIAQSDEYEHCLAMLETDPAGAKAYAEAWRPHGGGDGSAHCAGLAEIALGDPAEGAAALEALAGSSTAPDLARASVYDQAVQAWMMAEAPEHAYTAASKALALSPDDPDLLIDRATAAVDLGRGPAAVEDLDHALEIAPRRVEALILRAAALRRTGALDGAARDIDAAIALDPDNPEALLERGILRERTGDRLGARADWERTISLDPDSTTADLAEQNIALLDAGPALAGGGQSAR